VGEEECCYEGCSKPERRILKTEEWAETQCEYGCVVQCHKNCYRAHDREWSALCPRCCDGHVVGKTLYMKVGTAEMLRSKRTLVTPVPRRPRGVEGENDAKSASENEGASRALPASPSRGVSEESERSSAPASIDAVAAEACLRAVGAGPAESAHSRGSSSRSNAEAVPTSCDVCRKQFNGPKQFEAHMTSAKHLAKIANRRRLEEAGHNPAGATAARQPGRAAGSASRHVPIRSAPRPFAASNGPCADRVYEQLPSFSLSVAVEFVKNTLARFPNNEAHLNDLREAMDMSAYGVVDAERYFADNFDGLQTFLLKQQRQFKIVKKSFRDANFLVRPANDNVGAWGHSGRSMGAPPPSAPPAPATAPPPLETAFPTLDEGHLASMLGVATVDGLANRFQPHEPVPRTLPVEFRFSSSAGPWRSSSATFRAQDVDGYIHPTASADSDNVCTICFEVQGTHRFANCDCRALCCRPCLEAWVERSRTKKSNNGHAVCPNCNQKFKDVELVQISY
jgi:hypothetical protein